MKKITLTIIAIVAVSCVIVTGCKSSKKVATAQTLEQKQAADRGLKLEKEECEELAIQSVKTLRESGNGISDKEAFAVNLALLDARSKMSQQLEVLVNGLIRNFNQQHESDKDFSSVAKAGQIQQAYFEQFLTNTRAICKNTYVKDNGKYNVYVCIEMSDEDKRALYKKLSDDKKLQVDFQEAQFIKDFEKAQEDFRQQQSGK